MLHDIRFALRSLRKNPGFTIVVVLTLGSGHRRQHGDLLADSIRCCCAACPCTTPQQLVVLDGPGAFQGRTLNEMTFSYPMYSDFRDRNDGLQRRDRTVPGVADARMERTVGARQRRARDRQLLRGARRRPARSAASSTAADDRTPGAHPVVVLSYGYWQRRFGGDPSRTQSDAST